MRKCVLIVLCLFLQMHRTAVGEGLQFTMIDVGMAECMIVTCGSETKSDVKSWTVESMHTLEGGREAFYERKEIYESGSI